MVFGAIEATRREKRRKGGESLEENKNKRGVISCHCSHLIEVKPLNK